ncbi:MAG TPA: SpoIIE family protein phosphatase [Solirubrobacteraceae bacterium]|nr:SpoIIE family protein phosphatase [Solirubrobacteraceae bacterium]
MASLNAAGEVGRDLLAVDWQRTPLGRPEEWPASLRTIVRVVLASRFSMWMAWGPELTFFCNDAYRRATLGEKYPWALGRPASEVWAEIWPEVGPRIDRVLRTGQATWDESLPLFLERSGFVEETYHTFSYSPLADDDGQVVGMLCVVSEETERVIGERRIATLRDLGSVTSTGENERAFLQAAAEHLERNSRSLPFTAIYTFHGEGEARLAAASGLAPGEPAAPLRIAADDPHQVWPARELAAGHREEIVIEDLDRRFERVPAGPWPAPPQQALAVALLPSGGGEALGFLVVGINRYRPLDSGYRAFVLLIAQRLASGLLGARSYAAERERARQLAELDRAKTAFFSNVSHEFRTPLTLMLAPLQDALEADQPLAPAQVELVRRNGLRLLKLVNSLLDFSRLEAGRLQAQFRPVNVAALTAELAGTFRDAAQRAGIALEVDCEGLSGAAYVDPDLWERVVLNLVSNAFKVTLQGRITVGLYGEDDAFVLSVCDTGPGIVPEERDRIFDRFHQVRTPRARSHEGTGIGLALVKEIVELHGGRVRLASTVGEGSRFEVRIPFGRDHLPAEHVSEQPAEAAPGVAELFAQEALSWLPASASSGERDGPSAGRSVDGDVERVLIADDNPDLRRYLTRLLSPFWEVEAVADGSRALQIIRERPPDLLVSDVLMPGLGGFDLLRELRSAPETQELPVIMLSARAGQEASIQGLEAGADDYLPKPFSGRELLARVRSHLELSLVRRQASRQIREEQLLLEQTIRQLPAGVVLADAASGEIVMANQQVDAMFGQVSAGSSRISDYDARRQLYLADRRTPAGEQTPLARAIREGETVEDEEMAYRTAEGRWITLRVSAAPVLDPQGQIRAGVVVFQDISDRVLNERLLVAQRDVVTMIARAEPLPRTLEEIVAAAERLSDSGGLVSILLVSSDGRHLNHGIAPSLPVAYNEAIDGIEIGEGVGSCGTAAARRESVVVSDIQTDPLWADFRELAREHGLAACWSTPILASDGRLIGTFAVYYPVASPPSRTDRRTVALLSQTAAVAIERARDLQARAMQLNELQTSLLPPVLPDIPGLQAVAAFHSGDRSLEVGGDFYDLFSLEGGAWGLVIGDVCGHGAQAAAVTALARHSTWTHARLHPDPDWVLCLVSDALLARGYGRYCTAVYGRIELTETGAEVTLAAGGHPPPLLRRAGGTVERVTDHGPLLGVFSDPAFPVSRVTLEPGDALVLYTDGLIERNPRVPGEDELADLVAGLPAADAAQLLAALQDVALGPAPRRPRDDVAVLIVQIPR